MQRSEKLFSEGLRIKNQRYANPFAATEMIITNGKTKETRSIYPDQNYALPKVRSGFRPINCEDSNSGGVPE